MHRHVLSPYVFMLRVLCAQLTWLFLYIYLKTETAWRLCFLPLYYGVSLTRIGCMAIVFGSFVVRLPHYVRNDGLIRICIKCYVLGFT